jgi:tetratricopeptide (TPR) repeat protein
LEKNKIPSGLSFPEKSVRQTEAQWVELLLKGSLPHRSVEAGPGSFVTGEAWEEVLQGSFQKETETNSAGEKDWLSPYHLGVIAFEKGEGAKAAAFWEESLKRKENPWACRNLAIAALQSGGTQTALTYYKQALSLPGGQDQSFIQEYVPLLLDAGREEEAAAILESCISQTGSLEALPISLIEASARIAFNRGDTGTLDHIFSIEPAHIREGNNIFVDIWTEREIRKLTGKGISRGEAETQVRTALTEGSLVPPKEIDFRMFTRMFRVYS